MKLKFAGLLAFGFAAAIANGAEKATHAFEKKKLTDKFYCEGADVADFNRDGKMDLEAGPYWYEGPDFEKKHEIYEPKALDKNGYSANFLSYTYDFNADGWPDVLVFGWPGKESWWYENPKEKDERWKQHQFFDVVDGESPVLTDVTGDGKPEAVFLSKGAFGYASPDWDDPTKPWPFKAVTSIGNRQRYTHGLGVGDVNGDKRLDIIEKDGWWEQPAADSKEPFWKNHPQKFGTRGGAQMYAFDIDGDGDNDVVTSLDGHKYGFSWFENLSGDGNSFTQHVIMPEDPGLEKPFGIVFSQLHAMDIADVDKDGVTDLIIGKRHWAHNGKDPDEIGPAVLYWLKTVRQPGGKVSFEPNLIDDNSGVGTQVTAKDINGDGLVDVVVGNKLGTFVFIHK